MDGEDFFLSTNCDAYDLSTELAAQLVGDPSVQHYLLT